MCSFYFHASMAVQGRKALKTARSGRWVLFGRVLALPGIGLQKLLPIIYRTRERRKEMVKIEAVIKPSRLGDVQDALVAIGIQGMTVAEVQGFGRQKGHVEMYRGAEYSVKFIPKIMITLVIPKSQLSAAMKAIQKSASTGKIGDGKIFVSPISEVMRIRTGETGPDAL